MKKTGFKYLPLLLLPVTACLLIQYLSGWGIVPFGFEMYGILGCWWLLPFVISYVLVLLLADLSRQGRDWKIVCIFLGTLVLQFVLTFSTVPAGSAGVKLLGVAHRLKWKFSMEEVRKCAEDFRKKDKEGVLIFKDDSKKTIGLVSSLTRVVDEAQLPADLRGQFYCVRIGKEDRLPNDVFFEVGRDWGILCSTNRPDGLKGRHLMADGVYAYYYRRELGD